MKRMPDGSEKLLTRLKKGQYFGQKYFLTRQRRARNATLRIPNDSSTYVDIGTI
jgi:CRP-like cAMP-binding protein